MLISFGVVDSDLALLTDLDRHKRLISRYGYSNKKQQRTSMPSILHINEGGQEE